MERTIVFGAAILACLPMIAFGQTKRAVAHAEAPCCGQAVAENESIEQIVLETQLNLQLLLMQSTTAKRLPEGDYLVSESLEGFEFRALVSRQGIVDGWYVADWNGTPIALINSNGSPTGGAKIKAGRHPNCDNKCAGIRRILAWQFTRCRESG